MAGADQATSVERRRPLDAAQELRVELPGGESFRVVGPDPDILRMMAAEEILEWMQRWVHGTTALRIEEMA